MDPDLVLAQLRCAAEAIVDTWDRDGGLPEPADVATLAEGFLALDEWLTRGGFGPSVWMVGAGPGLWVHLELGNAALRDGRRLDGRAVADVLRALADRVADGERGGHLRDGNGNRCGRWVVVTA